MSSELVLSKDLNIITAEINSYKQVAGQAIFEIGRRLKWVKENDLVHGEFGNWLEKIEMNHSTANKMMKIVNELDGKSDTYPKLGFNVLAQIATLPEEERIKSHTIPSSGEQKTVDEMTVRELREVKAALKKAEEERNRLGQLLNEERNKPSKVETKVVETVKEVIPQNIKSELSNYKIVSEAKDKEINRLKQLLNTTAKEKEETSSKLHRLQQEKSSEESQLRELELKEKKLKHESHVSIYELQLKIQSFIKDASPGLFLQGAIAYGDPMVRKELVESVKSLEEFVDKMKDILDQEVMSNTKNKTIIDVEVM